MDVLVRSVCLDMVLLLRTWSDFTVRAATGMFMSRKLVLQYLVTHWVVVDLHWN